MNEAEKAEIDRRVKAIVEEFEGSPEFQDQVIKDLQADGIIDDRGQVICLGNGKRRDHDAND